MKSDKQIRNAAIVGVPTVALARPPAVSSSRLRIRKR